MDCERGKHHALVDDVFGRFSEVVVGIFLHFAHDEFLIQRAAVDADAHRLAVVARHLADRGKLFVAALAVADVAGIDAVFIERSRAIGIFREQDVAVVMEVADDGDVAAGVKQALLDFGDGRGGFGHVHRDADKFGAGLGKFEALLRGGGDVGRVGVGHGLHDDWRAAAYLDVADLYADRFVALLGHRFTF